VGFTLFRHSHVYGGKIFQKHGKVITEHYPLNEKGETKGYIFLEYAKHSEAVDAIKHLNMHKMDKNHTFQINLFSDFEKFENIPEVWEPPKEEAYTNQGERKSFLMNEAAHDQYAVVFQGGEQVGVYRNALPEAVKEEERPRWTESYIRWSPQGSYMATVHSRGIAIWGGANFGKISRFNHPGVQYIDFSPGEKYLVTFSPNQARGTEGSVIIWEARTGMEKRSFTADRWPVFKWSHDDKYFARMSGDGVLSIYETPSFGLLDKKSIKVSGMRDFSWSPTENILAYWVAEDKDVPARVTLLEIPSKNEVRVKNLFNVADCKMHWQKTGD